MGSGVFMDIAGVLYDGNSVIAGAPDALSELRDANVPVRFLTNSTRRPKGTIVQTLKSFGMPVELSEVLPPAEAACDWLRKEGHSAHLLVHPDLEEDFADAPSSGPTAVVIGDAGRFFTFERMNAAFRELANGAPLLALAHNRVFRDADGLLSLDAGAFVKALEYASRTSALLLGKPSRAFFEAGARSMGLPPEDVVMIGDDAESDVAGAISAGLGAGVLVRTGKYRDGDESSFDPPPSWVAENLGEAVGFVVGQRG